MTWKECQEQYTQYTEFLEEFFESYESLENLISAVEQCIGRRMTRKSRSGLCNLQKWKFAQALNVPEKKFYI